MRTGSRQMNSYGKMTSISVRVAAGFPLVSQFVFLLPLLWFGCMLLRPDLSTKIQFYHFY